ncbi:aspartate aminotransferase family protein [Amaricoccus solimangrovi]|uniref:Aminotransferase class III-fold pyridoxal phosphate-dependent enzyme n=1 Tax=Amaricoccus solimangrovi TaxID=2589815 RepID=A0A501WLF1_9RHOB|nr:aminotransferase class III-fold pyridoxal phosphate-dependent enzyme [Amaricoccus solimangrovi]TPE48037.1 aminotransferase class III-fold pyridoxal phosphate-dependent enzyme [Amaricoccus solimangrovi]
MTRPDPKSLAEALDTARDAYRARNPRSAELHAAARATMPGGNTRTALHFAPFPLYAARSAGARITDVDGHDYLDALGEYTAGLYGHSHPVVVEAVRETLAAGVSNGAPGPADVALARLIAERFPAVEQLRFCNSGTEANLYALTLARIATGRGAVMAFEGAYHGGVLNFGGGAAMRAAMDWRVERFNDPAIGDRIRAAGDRLAAVIVEPIMTNAGCIPAEPAFLAALREACDATGALLIFDEIVTSRHGPAGAQGLYGLRPDLTTLGKYLGGGFSFGAFGGPAELMARFDPFRPDGLPHAGTFNNNVFSMRVGAAALERAFPPERAEALFADGERLRCELNAICAGLDLRVRFTGRGSIMAVHFTADPILRPDDLPAQTEERALLHLDLIEAGLYSAPRGQFALSLAMEAADMAEISTTISAALERRRALYPQDAGLGARA